VLPAIASADIIADLAHLVRRGQRTRVAAWQRILRVIGGTCLHLVAQILDIGARQQVLSRNTQSRLCKINMVLSLLSPATKSASFIASLSLSLERGYAYCVKRQAGDLIDH